MRKRIALFRYCIALLVAMPFLMPKDARALTGMETLNVIQTIAAVISAAKDFKSFFEPSLASQMETAVNKVMKEARDQRWRTTTATAIKNIRTMQSRQPEDPANLEAYGIVWNSIGMTLDEMNNAFADSNDRASLYKNAPTMNVLAAVWIGLLNMKKAIQPDYPEVWVAYHERLQPVINLNYQMAGHGYFFCHPGFNPGDRLGYNYEDMLNNGFDVSKSSERASYYKSQLWQHLGQKVAINSNSVGMRGSKCESLLKPWVTTINCNMEHLTCWFTVANKSYGLFRYGWEIETSCMDIARKAFWTPFEKDNVVKIIHTSSEGMLALGSGESPEDNNDTWFPRDGKYLDPWVDEYNYCSAQGGKAYPANYYKEDGTGPL